MNVQYANERTKGGKQPVLYIFGRESKDSGRIRTRVTGFKPHFWGSCSDEEADTLDHFGRPVKYITTQIPTDVRDEREKYDYHCEADILFNIRYLIDKKILCGYTIEDGKVVPADDPGVPPLIFYFDAEVMSPPEEMPRSDDPKWPVVAISVSNSYDNHVVIFTYGIEVDEPVFFKTLEWVDKRGTQRSVTVEVEIRNFDTERELLKAFLDYLCDLDPDVLAAWNGYLFDYPYIHKRAIRLGLQVRRISPFGVAQITQGYGARRFPEYRIKGRDALDLLVVYRRWRSNLGQLPSYDFKYVVALDTGYEYVDYGDKIKILYEADHETLIEYCINDAFALKLLDEEKELIYSYDRKRRLCGVMIGDALSNKKLIDTWLLRNRERPLPSARRSEAEGFIGAVVLPARIGVHTRVCIFDLASLYPNAIVGYNVSPECLDDNGTIKITDPDTGRVIRFKRHPEGLLATTVRTFLEEREKYRTLKRTLEEGTPEYDRIAKRELDYKWLSVSAYGVFGYVNFRLFNETVAQAITALGRTYVGRLVKRMLSLGYDVIYGDTDSVFIRMRTDRDSEVIVVENHLNKIMGQIAAEHWARYAPRIKFEQKFVRFIMRRKIGKEDANPAKKKYAGATTEGVLYIRGLEPRRSDTAEITRESVTRWLEMVLIEDNLSGACTYLKEVSAALPSMPPTKVGIPKGIYKATTGPWVRGRDYSARVFNYKFRPDRKPILLYVKRVRGLPATKEICITEDITEVPKGVTVDWAKMREKILQRKFKGLLEAAGTSWDEAILGRKQTTLTSYSNFKY